MKTAWVVAVLLLACVGGPAEAQMFQTVDADQAQLLQFGPGKAYCPNCGMNLVKFYKTNHALVQPDGQVHQFCSLHCLVEAHPKSFTAARVIDGTTFLFIEAATATYVVGSAKPGTMTMKSKYAFASPDAARAFALSYGGELMDFAGAAALASTDLPLENQKIEEKRAKMAVKGQKIFAGMCQDVELPQFHSIAAAKTYLAQTEACGVLQDDQLQALAIFLMRGERVISDQVAGIAVPEGAKCPVCGMFVAKYPKWAALVEIRDGRKFYFDGAKDLMKFLFAPADFQVDLKPGQITRMLVTDYYTLVGIPADEAYFVLGSNIFGPMGNELIPFATEKSAQIFLDDHGGERVVPYTSITPEMVADLDR